MYLKLPQPGCDTALVVTHGRCIRQFGSVNGRPLIPLEKADAVVGTGDLALADNPNHFPDTHCLIPPDIVAREKRLEPCIDALKSTRSRSSVTTPFALRFARMCREVSAVPRTRQPHPRNQGPLQNSQTTTPTAAPSNPRIGYRQEYFQPRGGGAGPPVAENSDTVKLHVCILASPGVRRAKDDGQYLLKLPVI